MSAAADTMRSTVPAATAGGAVALDARLMLAVAPRVSGIRARRQAAIGGAVGPRTAAALRRVQARLALVADGIAGPVTHGALGLPAASSAVPGAAHA